MEALGRETAAAVADGNHGMIMRSWKGRVGLETREERPIASCLSLQELQKLELQYSRT